MSDWRLILIFPLFLALVLFPTGCNQGSVAVSGDDTPSGTPPGTAAPDTSGSGPSKTTAGDTGATAAGATVYFSAFETDATVATGLGHAIGIGFLPGDTTVTSGFELRLPCALNGTGSACLFAPESDGFVYADSTINSTSLQSLRVATLDTVQVSSLTAPARAIAASPDGMLVAVSDGSGTIQVFFNGTREAPIVIANGSVARLAAASMIVNRYNVNWGLLVTTDKETLRYDVDAQGSSPLPDTYPSTLAAIDPLTGSTAWVSSATTNSPAQFLNIWDAKAQQNSTQPLPTGTISELAYAGSGAVVFRLDAAGAGSEVDRMDLASGAIERVAQLAIDSAAGPGIVCPTGTDAEVFFGDRADGIYSIFSATRAGSEWKVAPFAVPDQAATAFVCPQLSEEISQP